MSTQPKRPTTSNITIPKPKLPHHFRLHHPYNSLSHEDKCQLNQYLSFKQTQKIQYMSTSMYNILKFLYREYGHDYGRIQKGMCGYGVDEGGFVRVSAVYCDKEDKNHHNYQTKKPHLTHKPKQFFHIKPYTNLNTSHPIPQPQPLLNLYTQLLLYFYKFTLQFHYMRTKYLDISQELKDQTIKVIFHEQLPHKFPRYIKYCKVIVDRMKGFQKYLANNQNTTNSKINNNPLQNIQQSHKHPHPHILDISWLKYFQMFMPEQDSSCQKLERVLYPKNYYSQSNRRMRRNLSMYNENRRDNEFSQQYSQSSEQSKEQQSDSEDSQEQSYSQSRIDQQYPNCHQYHQQQQHHSQYQHQQYQQYQQQQQHQKYRQQQQRTNNKTSQNRNINNNRTRQTLNTTTSMSRNGHK